MFMCFSFALHSQREGTMDTSSAADCSARMSREAFGLAAARMRANTQMRMAVSAQVRLSSPPRSGGTVGGARAPVLGGGRSARMADTALP